MSSIVESSSPAARRLPELPAWALSAGLHAAVFTLIWLVVLAAPERQRKDSQTRPTGVVVARQVDKRTAYFKPAPAKVSQKKTQAAAAPAAALLPPDPAPLAAVAPDRPGFLPTGEEPLAGGLPGSEIPGVANLKGSRGLGGRGEIGEAVETEVFGIKARGTKFVYVFDRSTSMAGYGGAPLRAAKEELIESLSQLSRGQQFQIIFYNQQPEAFHPLGERARMFFADERRRNQATRWVERLQASGSTRHLDALMMALGLSPDVIFFLTDAEDPILSAADLQRVERYNSGATIHAIEFGVGPYAGNSFLQRLANQSGGQHRYVDVRGFSKQP